MLRSTIKIVVQCSKNLNVQRVVNTTKWQVPYRCMSHGFFRTPRAIVNEDEIFEAPDDDKITEKQLERRAERQRKRKKQAKAAKKSSEQEIQQNEKPKEKNMFTKLYENERFLNPIIMQVKTKLQRHKNKKILLEGHRLIKDAFEADLKPEAIIFSRLSDLLKLPKFGSETNFYKVQYKTIQVWSSLTTPPGLMGIFPMPEVLEKPQKYFLPLTIICDNIRDPGNLGSILRSAAGVGCAKILLTKGCVDLWESKVLRSAAGAHFRIPIQTSVTWDKISSMISPEADVFIADNNNDEVNPDRYQEDNSQKLDDENVSDDEENESDADEKKALEEIRLLRQRLGVVPYHAVDYVSSEVVLIVGGETEGVSHESLNFLEERNGFRVNVPLRNDIESLNSGTALGIIAYEVDRQFSMNVGEKKEKEIELADQKYAESLKKQLAQVESVEKKSAYASEQQDENLETYVPR